MSWKIRQSFHELVQIVKNNLDKSYEHFHLPPTERSLTTTRPYSYFHRRMFSWNKYLRNSHFILKCAYLLHWQSTIASPIVCTNVTRWEYVGSFAWLYVAEAFPAPSSPRYIIRSEVYRLRPNVQKSVPNLKFIMWVVVWLHCLPLLRCTGTLHWIIELLIQASAEHGLTLMGTL